MLVRRERSGDEPAIAGVHAGAFARPGASGETPPEVTLVDELRASTAWLPELSLVALDGDEIVGHVVCTRATIDDRFPVLGLGPLGVAAAHQRAGVGSALVHTVLGAADALGEPIVVLLGSDKYYPRFGFEPAAGRGITPPDESYGDHFQVRLLSTATPELRGAFRYAPPFEGL